MLALPRSGVPVAFEVAQALHAPLDIFLVRKLGVPGHEELAMGAIASGVLERGDRAHFTHPIEWVAAAEQHTLNHDVIVRHHVACLPNM